MSQQLSAIIAFSIIIIVPAGIFLLLNYLKTKKIKKYNKSLHRYGVNENDLLYMGDYVGGHIEIDNQKSHVLSVLRDDKLNLYHKLNDELIELAHIEIQRIQTISVEDASSIQQRVSLGRIALVGVFALGWQKKELNEQAFVVIEWKTEKLTHYTTFVLLGTNAMGRANTIRNKLIKTCIPDF